MDPKRLREATRREHEATEALLPLGHAGLTVEEYRAGLEALWPVVSSWERWAQQNAPDDLRGMLQGRRRAELLIEDLKVLNGGAPPEPVVAGGRTPAVDWGAVVEGSGPGDGFTGSGEEERFRARFLGVLYVLEGSTLGGRFLARHVVGELGENYAPATRYFQGYGEQTGPMWREVTGRLLEVPEALAEETIEAAKRAFRAFGNGLQHAMTLSRHPQMTP